MYNKNIMQNDLYTGLTKSEIKKIDQTFFIINNSYFKNQLENQTSQNSLPTEFHQQTEEKPIRRDTARCIMINSNHEICLLYSRAKDYFAIPGGGIEPGETLLQAVNREILEETGYTIDNIKPLGKAITVSQILISFMLPHSQNPKLITCKTNLRKTTN